MVVANPLAGVRGPRAGRTTGRSRLTIANLRSKYPDMVAGRAGQQGQSQPVAAPVASPPTTPASPVMALPQGSFPTLATLQAAAQSTSTMAGLAAMMSSLQELRAAQPQQPARGRSSPAQSGGRGLPAFARDMGTTPAQNIRIAKSIAGRYGWDSGAQWDALVELGGRESGWRSDARNPSSGAFGIPQALPATKMNQKAQQGMALPQIIWMLKYIKDRYGSPAAAIKWHNAHNWY